MATYRETYFTRAVRALLISDQQVAEAFYSLRAVYRKWAWLAGR